MPSSKKKQVPNFPARIVLAAMTVFGAAGAVHFGELAASHVGGGEVPIYGHPNEDGADIVGYEWVGQDEYRREQAAAAFMCGAFGLIGVIGLIWRQE